MHEPLNTLGGRFGFVAVYPGGRRIAEDQATWDEVPRDEALVSLDFVDFASGAVLFSLYDFDELFFSNECVSAGLGNQLTAKVFGGANEAQGATLVRVDVTGPRPVATKTEIPGHRFAVHAVRPGVRF